MVYVGLMFALLSGIFIAFQGGINGMMGKEVGIFTTVIVPVYTQVIILSLILFSKKELFTNISKLKDIKHGIVFLAISALLGLGIMSFMTFSIMKSGPLVAFAVVIFSQLFTSMLLEYRGAFEMAKQNITIYKVLGLILIMGGIKLFYK